MPKISASPDSQALNAPTDKATTKPVASPLPAAKPITPSSIVAQVDDAKLTRGQLDVEISKSMAALSGKVPPDRLPEATARIKKQIIHDFIVRTLLGKEVRRMKIEATDKEINEGLTDLKNSLPSGTTMDEMMKKNAITPEKLREEVSLGIRINKLVSLEPVGKSKPTEKEINAFYKKNKDKFKMPESVHARHILIAKNKGDNDAARTKQKAKAEDIRKQLIAGADFGEVAKTSSDCPSKANGGELGSFKKGEMVKPFEDAAFSQKPKEIGPVVETDFGYHIIQVLEHNQPQTSPLDNNTKAQITAFLQQQKRYEAFNGLLNRLKAKANIVVAE